MIDKKRRSMHIRHSVPRDVMEIARAMEHAISKAGIPGSERTRFIEWTVKQTWTTYKEERMNRRLIIENEIKSLGIRLPNGTVGKDYLHCFTLPLDKVFNPELVGAEELGLGFDINADGNCSVEGRPKQAGDFRLRLRFNTQEGEPASEMIIPVAFNPNPRSLWKNIPTDDNTMFYKPDSEKAYLKVEAGADGEPRKDIVAASQRGRSHAQEGKARDDHFAFHHCDESGWYVIAVADGAGSARYSRKGSEVACNTVIRHCKEMLADNPEFETAIREYEANRDDNALRTRLTRYVIDIIYNGAYKAHTNLIATSKANEGSVLKDFATTLMFAICKRYEFGWFIASFWVGDGAMALYDEKERSVKLLGTPDEGQYSGQTRFLTMPEIFRDKDVVRKRLRMSIVPDFTALFLMTDGVSDPMFETERNLNDYAKWNDFYRSLKEGFPEDEIGGVDLVDDNGKAADQLLGWLDFWSPGNHDDRTIAILY